MDALNLGKCIELAYASSYDVNLERVQQINFWIDSLRVELIGSHVSEAVHLSKQTCTYLTIVVAGKI